MSFAIDCRDLVVRYGSLVAVDRLSMSAGPATVLALLGPNGAGKTSTLAALAGYRPPASGAVQVLGRDPTREHSALVARIGVMIQRGGVYPYVRQFSKSGASVYRCPKGLPDTSSYRSVSSTYAMNDYLRPWQGAYPRGIPDASLALSQIESVSRTILLFEATQHPEGWTNRNGSPYFHSKDKATGRPVGVPQVYHHGGSNFLFCDGHVHFYHPRATMTREPTPTAQRYLTEDGQLVVGFGLGWAADADDVWRPFPGYDTYGLD